MVVRRPLALLLIPALIAASGAGSLLHTHVYEHHDHAEHHHGPAAHDHHLVVADREDTTPHLEGCDPGEHVVAFAFVCAAPLQLHGLDADLDLPGSLPPQFESKLASQPTDTRVHGPPSHAHISPRAPPAILHA